MDTPHEFDILIVEDSQTVRDLFGIVLKLHRYRVAFAENGQHASVFFESGQRARLILLDIMMPQMDGQRFLAWLHEFNEKSALIRRSKVLILSSLAAEQLDPDELPVDLVQGSLRKPVDVPTLLAAVGRILPAPKAEAAEAAEAPTGQPGA